jgi:hypothetical protein
VKTTGEVRGKEGISKSSEDKRETGNGQRVSQEAIRDKMVENIKVSIGEVRQSNRSRKKSELDKDDKLGHLYKTIRCYERDRKCMERQGDELGEGDGKK